MNENIKKITENMQRAKLLLEIEKVIKNISILSIPELEMILFLLTNTKK